MLKRFSKRVQFNEGNVIMKMCSRFKYVITLHVAAWLELKTQPEVTTLCYPRLLWLITCKL